MIAPRHRRLRERPYPPIIPTSLIVGDIVPQEAEVPSSIRFNNRGHTLGFILTYLNWLKSELKMAALYFFVAVAMALSLLSFASAAETGTATFYTPPYIPSSCDGFKNEGVMIAAASDTIWNNRAACGNVYKVKCIGATNLGDPHPCIADASVVVKIVDYCPSPGCQGTIDLSQEVFAMIANPLAGKINIAYQRYNVFTSSFIFMVNMI
ncbi:hypothetical protein GIB67_006075 [Kingdonia uniflora]|uniref:Expansin-like EG45 domain-containing protein n=1 Tax=Kingdonia uniflora TaxID=39325 RepID=A0A7J7LPN5_9MAGN|nr:hypothetical protein GIB67_006075 [Kingdonia uniflora]